MAITSVGYDGTVDEKQFRDIMGFSASSEYGVAEPGAFAASSVAGQVLQVRLTAGTAWTAGVVDKMDAADTVQLDPVASGSRWDMIVLRRDYQPPGGATTLRVVKGGGSMTLPALQQNRGVLDEQPLWLAKVEAGKSTPTQFVDLRVWARNGGATANHDLVRSYLNGVGTSVEINGILWLLRVGTNGQSEWFKPLGNLTDKAYVDEMVDSLLDVMPKTISGNATIKPKANTPTSINVKFPVGSGWFKRTPNVVATADTTVIGDTVKGVSVDDITRTGFRLWVHRTNTTQTKVYWVATE